MVPKQVQNMNEFYVSSTRFFASPPCVPPHTIDKTRPKYERTLYEQHMFFAAPRFPSRNAPPIAIEKTSPKYEEQRNIFRSEM